nr:hypothetical protein [Tanacetum cinerariifolium]
MMKIRRQTSHGAEMKIDLKNTEWVTDMYWKIEGTQSFEDFIQLAVTHMTPRRRYGYARLVNNLIENKTDTRMDGEDKYMALIPREWKNMSNCARRNLVPGERLPAAEAELMISVTARTPFVSKPVTNYNIKLLDQLFLLADLDQFKYGSMGMEDESRLKWKRRLLKHHLSYWNTNTW